jgi:cytochrome c oxidase accessory protein FixG
VYTEIFLWVERKIEGDRNARIKLDRAGLNSRKLLLKTAKHATWIAIALWTGFTFVGYVTPIRELWGAVMSYTTGPWETFWILFYGFATYGNAGWMREQVCLYMCPYARFQSAMFDRDTLIIGYDARRGEPRGSRGRGSDPRAHRLGDCIDCRMCVQVCPTGIDIRKGLQYECIGCGACIDACDRVMGKMWYPAGLIRYATESGLDGRPARVFRPRVSFYGILLVGFLGAFAYALSERVPLGLDVIRDRKTLFRERAGRIETVYTLKVLNMDERPHRYELHAEGIPGLDLSLDGPIVAEAGAVVEVPVRLMAEESRLQSRSTPVTFVLIAADDGRLSVREEARFLGPPP